ncbi:hypothetical protein GOODEAATRI_009467, partial [Goodea atripinnis]
NQSSITKDGQVPLGRGRGILVLRARTDISNSPEVGQRLFSAGTRGGAAGRNRGGRGGGVRRLWDPNNPDQKPALSNTQSSQHAALKQPLYLQTGTGYGQLHFLDTDDELASSPPVPQGDHFQSQQAAAMAYYKFQTSDNPYCYPIPPSNTQNPNSTTGQRYPYPYNMGPYQMAHPNGMYPSSGTSPFSGSYRGPGYTQPGVGAGLTFEDELGRLLKAADAHELQLSNLISRDRVSAEGLDRMSQLRADLLGTYERIILTDIQFSDSQNVDQGLWKNVFYQVIEHFRQLLKDPTCDNTHDIRNMLLTLLDEGALFFDALLQKLQAVYQFTLEEYMDGMAIRTRPLRKTVKYALISAQRCMICQGDIARYREQATNSANYGKARSRSLEQRAGFYRSSGLFFIMALRYSGLQTCCRSSPSTCLPYTMPIVECLADLCNALARVDHEEMPLYKVDTDEGEGDEELTVLQLKEDKLLAGFVPLLAAPQEPCYTDKHTDMAIAADCKRVTVLKYFLEALCGQEEPLLAFKGGKYISVAKEEDFEEAGDSENGIKELKARRHALANKLAQQQKRRDKIQAVLQTGGQLELEVRPLFLVPDTNGFIDHLDGLKNLLQCGTYIIVVPLIVITELDGLAKGQESFSGPVGMGGRSAGSRGNYNVRTAHVRAVQEQARSAVAFLEKGFEAREPCLRVLTSRGNQLESIAFRSEDTSGQQVRP